MTKLRLTARIDSSRELVFEYMTSQDYLDLICQKATSVSSGVVEANEHADGKIRHAVRWIAPTRVPSILKKYEAKAPKEVSWVEETVWDEASGEASFRVVPDVPAHWHDKYRSSGRIVLREAGGSTELTQELEFSLDFGLVGKALEKLLKGEVESLLAERLEVLRRKYES